MFNRDQKGLVKRPKITTLKPIKLKPVKPKIRFHPDARLGLNDEQTSVYSLIIEGLTDKQIGDALDIETKQANKLTNEVFAILNVKINEQFKDTTTDKLKEH